jgi:hypothetical protein
MALKHIAEGWFNSFLDSVNLLDEQTKILGENRMLVCSNCSIRKLNICSSQNESINIKGKSFKGCGCRIDKKVLCKECQCPGGYW